MAAGRSLGAGWSSAVEPAGGPPGQFAGCFRGTGSRGPDTVRGSPPLSPTLGPSQGAPILSCSTGASADPSPDAGPSAAGPFAPAGPEGVGRAVVDEVRRLLWHLGGPDFRLYSPALIGRRVAERIEQLGFASAEAYAATLHDDALERVALRQHLLRPTSRPFGDPPAWETLARDVIGPLCARRGGGATSALRVWVAGCATGEEAIAVALLLAQAAADAGQPADFLVIGTDVDEQAIALACAGRLGTAASRGLPAPLRERWLEDGPDGPRIAASLRAQLVFGVHDVLADAPFGDIDLLLCRHLLADLDDAGRRQALAGFAHALAPDGCLVLGGDETLPDGLPGWEVVSEAHGIHRRVTADAVRAVADVAGEDPAHAALQGLSAELQAASDELRRVNARLEQALRRERLAVAQLQAIVASAAEPMLVLDAQGRLEHFSRSAGQLFRLRRGDEGRPLEDFANDLVWPEFAAVIRDCAAGDRGPVSQAVRDIRGGHWLVKVTAPPGLHADDRKLLVTATDTTPLHDAARLQAVLDALPQQVAVLDAEGRIEYVNRAWHAFGRVNGADPARIDVGVDYLQASAPVAGTQPDPFGERAAQGIGDVLAARLHRFRMEYPCATPIRHHWFQLDASALAQPEGGCLVSHTDVTDLMQGQAPR